MIRTPPPSDPPKAQALKPIAPARAAAFHILSRVTVSAAHSDDLLHSLAVNALSSEDRNLTTTLVLGVLRWQLYLDALLQPMLQRPDAELHPSAMIALRLGLFQLLYLDRIPAHAALNESVELARANGAAHAASMVNAILRRVLREKPGSPTGQRVSGSTPAEQAHPEWLIARWRANLGGAAARHVAEYDQAEPPSHTLFTPEAGLPDMDDGSRLIAELAAVAVREPKRILDCCAAPGGKTAILAVRHPEAETIAADINEKRLSAMRKRMDRTPGTARVRTLVADMTQPSTDPLLVGAFDLILCDAPCSGTGTLARNPEIRHRLRASDLPRQAERQRAILAATLRLLAPGGRLLYSTCSLEPEENAGVVEAVLKQVPEVRAVPLDELADRLPALHADAAGLLKGAIRGGILQMLPGAQPCDGFYAAMFERMA